MNAPALALTLGCAVASVAAGETGSIGSATWHNGLDSAGWLIARTPSLIHTRASVLLDADPILAGGAYCRAAELSDDRDLRAEAQRRCADFELSRVEDLPWTDGISALPRPGTAPTREIPEDDGLGTTILGESASPAGLWLLPWRRVRPAQLDRPPAFLPFPPEPVDPAGLERAAALDESRRALRRSLLLQPGRADHSSQ